MDHEQAGLDSLPSPLVLGMLLAALPTHAATTGSGKAATETREASGFAAITLRGDMDLVVRQGAREGVQVTADDNLLPLLQTVVEGSGEQRTLVIQWPRGETIRTRAKTVVTVDVVKLTAVASSGSGDIAVEALKTPALTLSISGSSDARLRGSTPTIARLIAGSGDVRASGKAARLGLSIAGRATARARAGGRQRQPVHRRLRQCQRAGPQDAGRQHRRLGQRRVQRRGQGRQEPHRRQRLNPSAAVIPLERMPAGGTLAQPYNTHRSALT